MLVTRPTPPDIQAGFTLLEILLVLMIVGLAGAVVVPRVSVIYDNLVLRGEREALLRDIQTLPLRAQANSNSFAVAPDSPEIRPLSEAITPPEGWRVEFSEQLRYQSNGFCLGGEVGLTHRS
ncbi:MAG: type II secretion system protein, partial [Halieaceae bacterium]|nr:type II secretion system protein [Halieaceae bacterium]